MGNGWLAGLRIHECVFFFGDQVEIYSRCYESSPLVIQGAGAGNDTTAAGVLADIIDLQDLFREMA
jgi:homoserine dehydrogenase